MWLANPDPRRRIVFRRAAGDRPQAAQIGHLSGVTLAKRRGALGTLGVPQSAKRPTVILRSGGAPL